jgi:hypothetical protein
MISSTDTVSSVAVQPNSGKVVMVELEGCVKALLDSGFDDIQIHQLIELIINGHIVNGTFTEEYLHYAAQAKDDKGTTNSGIILLD